MIQYIKVPDGFVERGFVISGQMMSPTTSEQFGVIMTKNILPNPAAQPTDFDNEVDDITELIGLRLEDVKHKNYYEIIGGYFVSAPDPAGQVTTHRVFGIAEERAGAAKGFHITEGGSRVLYDDWFLTGNFTPDHKSEDLNERKPESTGGWTFIVLPHDVHFPISNDPLAIAQFCPEMTGIAKSEGELKDGKLEISFTAEFAAGEGESETVEWKFGDNETGTTTSAPHSISHTYTIPPEGLNITVKAEGKGASICETSHEIMVVVPPPPVICPELKSINNLEDRITDENHVFTFKAEFDPAKGESDKVDWKFGDGKEAQTLKGNHQVTHAYARKTKPNATYTVTCTGDPGTDCTTEASTSAEVEGYCPTLAEIVANKGELSDNSLKWNFEAKFRSGTGTPTRVEWDFGDGTEPLSTQGEHKISHVYARPKDAEKTHTVRVKSIGPDDCGDEKTTPVVIPIVLEPVKPEICPDITAISVSKSDPENDSIKVDFVAKFADFKGESTEVVWDFGDGSPTQTTRGNRNHRISHTYSQGDSDKTYTVTAHGSGPDDCETRVDAPVEIPKIPVPDCPKIVEVTHSIGDLAGGKRPVSFSVKLDPNYPAPQSYNWIWNVGDAAQPGEGNAIHEFACKYGSEVSYEVMVIAVGPGECEESSTVTVMIPECPCPEVKSVKAVITKKDDNTVTVTATAEVDGSPAKYTWDWGDGTETTTTSSTDTHVYQLGEATVSCPINLTISGPEGCEGSGQTTITIPEKEEEHIPFFCRVIPWITSFLLALTLAVLVVCVVDESCDGEINSGLITLTSILVILTFISVAAWFLFRKAFCPPKACDWYAIVATAFFAMTGASFYTMECCLPGAVWLPGLIFFLLGGVFAWLWFQRCSYKNRSYPLLTYFLIFLVSTAIATLGVANTYLECLP